MPLRLVLFDLNGTLLDPSVMAGPPAFVPVPDSRLPPNGWRATIAPVMARLT